MIVAYWHSNVQSAKHSLGLVAIPSGLLYCVRMMKKLLVTLIIAGIVIVSVTAALFLINQGTSFSGTTLAEIKKTLNEDSPVCLKNSSTATVTATDQYGLETAVLSSISDVPAGTNVDILVATFSDTEATGSAKYADGYGTYNFVVKNVLDATTNGQTQSVWETTSFVACKG